MGAMLSAEDERQIRFLVSRYHDAVTLMDVEAWGATWAADGQYSIGAKTVAGREAIISFWSNEVIAPFEGKLFQLVGHGRVWLGEHGPAGRWMFLEIGRRPGREEDYLSVGCFLDRYVKEKGSWLFAERRFSTGYRQRHMKAGEFVGFPPLERDS